jgi:hypothetical protein
MVTTKTTPLGELASSFLWRLLPALNDGIAQTSEDGLLRMEVILTSSPVKRFAVRLMGGDDAPNAVPLHEWRDLTCEGTVRLVVGEGWDANGNWVTRKRGGRAHAYRAES